MPKRVESETRPEALKTAFNAFYEWGLTVEEAADRGRAAAAVS